MARAMQALDALRVSARTGISTGVDDANSPLAIEHDGKVRACALCCFNLLMCEIAVEVASDSRIVVCQCAQA
jgi:hypothetical protein